MKVVVVGCIHGNECAGIRVVRALEEARLPPGIDLWLVPDANPDGRAALTRVNAHGVDLNRNFPWHWRPSLAAGNPHYSGPSPVSEAESLRALYPPREDQARGSSSGTTQSLAVVDESGGGSHARASLLSTSSAFGSRKGVSRALPGKRCELGEPRVPGNDLVRRRATSRAADPCLGPSPRTRRACRGANLHDRHAASPLSCLPAELPRPRMSRPGHPRGLSPASVFVGDVRNGCAGWPR